MIRVHSFVIAALTAMLIGTGTVSAQESNLVPAASADPAVPDSNGVATPAEAPAAESTTAIAAEADQARPAFAAVQPSTVAQQSLPGFEQRTVVVPDHEQLKPESMVRGVLEDLLKERPWLPYVAIAFLLGVLFGRARRNSW